MIRIVAALVALVASANAAQYSRHSGDRLPQEWESDQFRVRRIVVPAAARVSEPDAADSILVYLTADLDGRMPPVEAVWQPAGARTLENRGPARFDAIAIELKDVPASAPAATPPETIPSTDQIDIWRLIDNPRVLATKLRYRPVTSVDPMHFHLRDTLVVYLKGGYVWQPVEQSRDWYVWPFMRWAPTERVARGDVDVVPANTFHSFGNAGGDPLEFLAIFVK